MGREEKEEAEITCIRLSSSINTSALFSGQMYLGKERWLISTTLLKQTMTSLQCVTCYFHADTP